MSPPAETDENGEFPFYYAAKGFSRLELTTDSLASFDTFYTEEPANPLIIRLQPGVVVRGKFLDSEGHPIIHAPLKIEQPSVTLPKEIAIPHDEEDDLNRNTSEHFGSAIYRTTVTNERGEFAFLPMPEGKYTISSDPDEKKFIANGECYEDGNISRGLQFKNYRSET